MAQFRENAQSQGSAAEQRQEQEQSLGQHREVDQDLLSQSDSILDEIDSVLEENAEDYVSGFVQKGGQ